MSLLLRNATILTMNDAGEVLSGDVLIEGDRIAAIGALGERRADRVLNLAGNLLLPGFVQTHVHLCQTLFRGYADDLALLDWLKLRIWPMEAAHTRASLAAAAELAVSELLLGGTTTVLTMETVHDTDVVLDTVAPMGIRAVVGKCLMDADRLAPSRLQERASDGIASALALARACEGMANGRVRTALAPRFVPSCSRELLEQVAALSTGHGWLIHTHASENRDEVSLVRSLTGMSNIDYFAALALTSPRLCAAHCVWVDEREQDLLAAHDVKVLHCPGSNLKLASGVAPVVEMRARGISVSLGADGGACNNELDMFKEMRLAAGLQAVARGAGALPARDVLHMATREGARALGLQHEIGMIAEGFKADLIVIDTDRPHLATCPDPISAVVYSTRPSDVRTTIVDGQVLVDDFCLTMADRARIAAVARDEAQALAARAF